VFLWEHYYLFQLKEVFENRPYLGSYTRTFLEIFFTCDFDEQSLLREFHNIMCEYVGTKMVASVFSYMGDFNLQAFLLFTRNQIEWHMAMKSTKTNDERVVLWVRAEPGMVYELRHEFKMFLSTSGVMEQVSTYKKKIVWVCLKLHARMKSQALAGYRKHIEACSIELQEGYPF